MWRGGVVPSRRTWITAPSVSFPARRYHAVGMPAPLHPASREWTLDVKTGLATIRP
jgi:hypothetical protein